MKQFTFIVFALKVSFSSEFLFTQSGKVRESYKSFQMFNGKSCCYNFLITNFWKCKSYRFKVNTRDIQGFKWRNDIIQNMYICTVYKYLCTYVYHICMYVYHIPCLVIVANQRTATIGLGPFCALPLSGRSLKVVELDTHRFWLHTICTSHCNIKKQQQ